jgi:hypothetical protein
MDSVADRRQAAQGGGQALADADHSLVRRISAGDVEACLAAIPAGKGR